MWPREVFDCDDGTLEKLDLLKEKGVYVLYRDDVPYYVGRATKDLRLRLSYHAKKPGSKYYNFWNFFSVFVPGKKASSGELEAIRELEAILISAMPTANGAKPKLEKKNFPKEVKDLMRRIRMNRIPPSP